MSHWNDPATGVLDRTPTRSEFLDDVVQGLSAEQKTLPCKYFYDERGSQLFDQICDLEEYYLTRTELQILRGHAGEIADAVGSGVTLVEPGSGSSIKTRILLDHLHEPAEYVPIDISREHLIQSAKSLADRYPDLPVNPVSADFTQPFELPESADASGPCVVYFPGSTIGNFTQTAASALLERIAEISGPGGGLLIGIDLKKDREILEAAYDDAQGVTAEFNLNILRRINRELDGNFDLDAFQHKAEYNPGPGRIEIALVSEVDQSVSIGEHTFEFAAGEEICTEHCHKYEIDEFAARARRAGFELTHRWTDDREFFAVLLLQLAESEAAED